ncbi:MAG: uracil phosphoribosyltransferase [Rikenellaceae bacterium]|nr:uracil phosphoribosyltransferase [Rikenellaceae bacterium]
MLTILGNENSILNRFLAQLRDMEIQKNSMLFRKNLERIGELMAYEISKTLSYENRIVETPLGEAEMALPNQEIVLAAILRAGIPMHSGFLNIFDQSHSAFVSAYRHYRKNGSFQIDIESLTTPELAGKILILIDPMLATGQSIEVAYNNLIQSGEEPKFTHIATVIASQDGVDYVQKHFSCKRFRLWTVAVDKEMTVKSYIVPGIGDTGDLAFGEKIG